MKLDTKDLLPGMEEDITLDYVSIMFHFLDQETQEKMIKLLEDYYTPEVTEDFLKDSVTVIKKNKLRYEAMAERRKKT